MPYRNARWMLVWFEACAALGVTFFLALSLWIAGPTLEVWLFPVASKLELLHVTSDPAGTRIQEARFTKLRNCEFRGITWFYKSPTTGNLSRVPLVADQPSRRVPVVSQEMLTADLPTLTRPVGGNLVGPWIVGLPIQDMLYHSFARIHHRCHNFWMTTTDFYP
jgi:hypothetical protein